MTKKWQDDTFNIQDLYDAKVLALTDARFSPQGSDITRTIESYWKGFLSSSSNTFNYGYWRRFRKAYHLTKTITISGLGNLRAKLSDLRANRKNAKAIASPRHYINYSPRMWLTIDAPVDRLYPLDYHIYNDWWKHLNDINELKKRIADHQERVDTLTNNKAHNLKNLQDLKSSITNNPTKSKLGVLNAPKKIQDPATPRPDPPAQGPGVGEDTQETSEAPQV